MNSLDSISEISFVSDLALFYSEFCTTLNQDYDLGIFLRLKWNDPRLAFDRRQVDGEDSLNIDALMYDYLWVPDLYVTNEKQAYFHTVVTPNRLIKLNENGTIMYSSRLYLTLNCQMELHAFPFDSQYCYFQINSCKWNANVAVK